MAQAEEGWLESQTVTEIISAHHMHVVSSFWAHCWTHAPQSVVP